MRVNTVSFKGNSASNNNYCKQRTMNADCSGGGCKKPVFGEGRQYVDRRQYDLAISQIARLNALNKALILSVNSEK